MTAEAENPYLAKKDAKKAEVQAGIEGINARKAAGAAAWQKMQDDLAAARKSAEDAKAEAERQRKAAEEARQEAQRAHAEEERLRAYSLQVERERDTAKQQLSGIEQRLRQQTATAQSSSAVSDRVKKVSTQLETDKAAIAEKEREVTRLRAEAKKLADEKTALAQQLEVEKKGQAERALTQLQEHARRTEQLTRETQELAQKVGQYESQLAQRPEQTEENKTAFRKLEAEKAALERQRQELLAQQAALQAERDDAIAAANENSSRGDDLLQKLQREQKAAKLLSEAQDRATTELEERAERIAGLETEAKRLMEKIQTYELQLKDKPAATKKEQEVRDLLERERAAHRQEREVISLQSTKNEERARLLEELLTVAHTFFVPAEIPAEIADDYRTLAIQVLTGHTTELQRFIDNPSTPTGNSALKNLAQKLAAASAPATQDSGDSDEKKAKLTEVVADLRALCDSVKEGTLLEHKPTTIAGQKVYNAFTAAEEAAYEHAMTQFFALMDVEGVKDNLEGEDLKFAQALLAKHAYGASSTDSVLVLGESGAHPALDADGNPQAPDPLDNSDTGAHAPLAQEQAKSEADRHVQKLGQTVEEATAEVERAQAEIVETKAELELVLGFIRDAKKGKKPEQAPEKDQAREAYDLLNIMIGRTETLRETLVQAKNIDQQKTAKLAENERKLTTYDAQVNELTTKLTRAQEEIAAAQERERAAHARFTSLDSRITAMEANKVDAESLAAAKKEAALFKADAEGETEKRRILEGYVCNLLHAVKFYDSKNPVAETIMKEVGMTDAGLLDAYMESPTVTTLPEKTTASAKEHHKRALALQKEGKTTEAVKQLELGLLANAADPRQFALLAVALSNFAAETRQMGSARVYANLAATAVALHPLKNPEAQSLRYTLIASAYARAGEHDLAREYTDRAKLG